MACFAPPAQFKMLWAIKDRFPLHFIVFKQTASHIGHEANVERLFSRSGLLSDPNMHPKYLGLLTAIRVNKAAYKPWVAEIKAKYYQKFRKSAQGGDDDEGEPGAPPTYSPRKRAAKQAASTPSRKSPWLNAAA